MALKWLRDKGRQPAPLRDKLRPQFIGGKAPAQQADVSRLQVRQMWASTKSRSPRPIGDEQRVQDQAVEHIGQRRQARLGMPARGPGLVGALDPAESLPQRGVRGQANQRTVNPDQALARHRRTAKSFWPP